MAMVVKQDEIQNGNLSPFVVVVVVQHGWILIVVSTTNSSCAHNLTIHRLLGSI